MRRLRCRGFKELFQDHKARRQKTRQVNGAPEFMIYAATVEAELYKRYLWDKAVA